MHQVDVRQPPRRPSANVAACGGRLTGLAILSGSSCGRAGGTPLPWMAWPTQPSCEIRAARPVLSRCAMATICGRTTRHSSSPRATPVSPLRLGGAAKTRPVPTLAASSLRRNGSSRLNATKSFRTAPRHASYHPRRSRYSSLSECAQGTVLVEVARRQ